MTALASVGSNTGFRERLEQVAAAGSWDCPAGGELIAEFASRCGRRAGVIAAKGGVSLRNSLADDLTGRMWEHVDAKPDTYLAAGSPWGFFQRQLLWTADEVCTGQQWLTADPAGGTERSQLGRQAVPARYESAAVLAEMIGPDAGSAPVDHREAAVRDGLAGLIDGLVDAGMDRTRAVEAVGAAADLLMAHSSRHLAHTRAYADPTLTGLLPRDEIRALMNLIVGTRRGGAESSALGALITAAEHGQRMDLAQATSTAWRDVTVLAQGGPDQLTLPFAS